MIMLDGRNQVLVRLKCNIDDSFNSLGIKVGLDMYNRNVLGTFVLAKPERFTYL
jgi:hypothetical protein